MSYRFKPLPELYWGVVIAASLVLLQALLTLDPEKVADWRVWAVALGGAAVRAAAGAALDYLRRSMTDTPEPTLADEILALNDTELAALRTELDYRRNLPPPPPPPPVSSDPHRDLPGSVL
jgi:hypothetical protein